MVIKGGSGSGDSEFGTEEIQILMCFFLFATSFLISGVGKNWTELSITPSFT